MALFTLKSSNSLLTFDQTLIMGILNVTPNSFVSDSRVVNPHQALDRAWRFYKAGASVIDIGGQSTHPRAQPISAQEEMDRVIPVIELLRKQLPVWISVDTYYPKVMQAAITGGVQMINDVRALTEPGAVACVANARVAVCLMHRQARDQKTFQTPRGILGVVYDYLAIRIEVALAAGIDPKAILIDPGFGFGKSLHDNYRLLAQLKKLQPLNCPILMGVSRKGMVSGRHDSGSIQALIGTVVASTWGVLQGVQMIRAHDVAETVHLRDITERLKRALSAKEGSVQQEENV